MNPKQTPDASRQTPAEEPPPQIRVASEPMSLPVFNCIVYVRRETAGQVKARVANLPELRSTADNEPAALRLVVDEFKQRVTEWTAAGEPIPWIDPPRQPSPDEQQRLIPVHL